MRLLYLIFVLASVGLLFSQCRKGKITTDPNVVLSFSTDTVLFDTVFTTVGSTTKYLRVRNTNKNAVKVSSMRLAGGSASPFRINIDGIPTVEANDVEILGNDSIFIFVEVTLEVNNLTNPLIIEDSIIFETNGNRQSVRLVVWGQDAYFHVNDTMRGVWNNDKPHVIYGIAAVGYPGIDSNATLDIPAGTHVYVHANSLLYVYKSTLNIQGLEGNEVIFEGDRLEQYYKDKPGQWDGIWLIHSENSTITHAIIKNGNRGIWVYKTNPTTASIALTINNTESYNHAFSGIWCDETRVDGTNNLFVNNGQYCGVFVNGGEYNFNCCTFANYWGYGDRTAPCFLLNNNVRHPVTNAVIAKYAVTNTLFDNCIFDGSQPHEFEIDTVGGITINYLIRNCILRSDETITTNINFYETIFKNATPGFVDPNEGDFHLKSNAFAKDRPNGTYPSADIDENPRGIGGAGDLGCYEYQ